MKEVPTHGDARQERNDCTSVCLYVDGSGYELVHTAALFAPDSPQHEADSPQRSL